MLLQSVLMELGNDVKPLYLTHYHNDPAVDNYYLSQVHIRGGRMMGIDPVHGGFTIHCLLPGHEDSFGA